MSKMEEFEIVSIIGILALIGALIGLYEIVNHTGGW